MPGPTLVFEPFNMTGRTSVRGKDGSEALSMDMLAPAVQPLTMDMPAPAVRPLSMDMPAPATRPSAHQ